MRDSVAKGKLMERRPNWLVFLAVSAAVAALVAGIGLLLQIRGRHRELHGPVAVVRGTPPSHGFLGLEFDQTSPVGLTIQSVLAGSGAADAGLQPGDVVIAIEENSNPDGSVLLQRVKATKPGDQMKLKISRGANQFDVSVTVISFEEMVFLREQDRAAAKK